MAMTGRYRVYLEPPVPVYFSAWKGGFTHDAYRAMSGLVSIAKSLAASGAEYSTEVNTNPERPYIEVTARSNGTAATGKKPKSKRKPKTCADIIKVSTMPTLVTGDKAERELAAARKALIEYKGAWIRHIKSGGLEPPYYRKDYDHNTRMKQRAFGQMFARIVARHQSGGRWRYNELEWKPTAEDYAELDRFAGHRCRRYSELNSHDQERGWPKTMIRDYGGCSYVRTRRELEEREKDRKHPTAPEPATDWAYEWQVKLADVEYWEEMLRLTKERNAK